MSRKLVVMCALGSLFLLSACVTSSVIPKDDITDVQRISLENNLESYGCFTGVIRGSSGVVGGETQWTVIWGNDPSVVETIVDKCIQR